MKDETRWLSIIFRMTPSGPTRCFDLHILLKSSDEAVQPMVLPFQLLLNENIRIPYLYDSDITGVPLLHQRHFDTYFIALTGKTQAAIASTGLTPH